MRLPSRRRPRRATRVLTAAVVAVLTLTAASAGSAAGAPVPTADSTVGNPFAGATTYVNPSSPASLAAAAEPDPERARQLRRVASGGNGEWYGDWSPTPVVTRSVADRIARIRATGALPVFVVYHIPLRDCGSYSAGGATSPQAYRDWIDAFAAGLGTHRAVVILEPDSLADMGCLSYPDQEVRYALLRYALARFNALTSVSTYLDGGHSGWLPASTIAYRLNRANVAEARGFALNVSNFRATADEVAYGRDVAARTGGKTFVIDTSRNGLGPAGGTNGWCNPPGRALGSRPLSTVPHRQVDAMLWIKVPGQSDGSCGRGEPAPGTFWPDYAIGLSSRAAW